MSRRSHESLRARDLGLAALRPQRYSTRPRRLTPTDHERTAWLRRTHATLHPPTPHRPYYAVFLGPTFLAAARSPDRALTKAMQTPFPLTPPHVTGIDTPAPPPTHKTTAPLSPNNALRLDSPTGSARD